jgi:hypothetical protein
MRLELVAGPALFNNIPAAGAVAEIQFHYPVWIRAML